MNSSLTSRAVNNCFYLIDMFSLPKLFACTTLMASLALTACKTECLPLSLAVTPLAFKVICDKSNCNSKSDSVKQLPDEK